jgi:hypothetical protein
MTEEKEQRLRALNTSEETLRRISEELNEAGLEPDSNCFYLATEFLDGFISKLLIEYNKTLVENEKLKSDIESLTKQVVNSLKK